MTRFNFNYKTASGVGSLVLEKCTETFFKQFKLLGNSVQETTTGKNLFDINAIESGADIKIIESGVEVISNEAYPRAKMNNQDFLMNAIKNSKTKKLVINFKECGNAINFIRITANVKKGELISEVYTDTRNVSLPINTTDITEIIDITFEVFWKGNSPVIGQGWVKGIQLEFSDKPTPYEPYTGGKPSPSPEYPQEIISAGRKSRNLFDITKLKSSMTDVGINTEENTITLPSGGAIYFNKLKECADLKVGDEVYLFAKSTGKKDFIGFYNGTGGIPQWKFNVRNVITEQMLNSTILLYSDSDKSVVLSDIMITKLNDKIYEPYSDKFLFDVQVTGKNLFNGKYEIGSLDGSNGKIYQSATKFATTDFIKVIPNNNYCYNGGTYREKKICEYDENKNFLKTTFSTSVLTTINTRYIRCQISLEKENTMVDNAQVHIGTNTTEYEPYREPQTIKLSLNQPLRGIGEHKDEVTKDGIVRRIKQIMWNGSEKWSLSNAVLVNTNKFYLPKVDDAYSAYRKISSLVDALPFVADENSDELGQRFYLGNPMINLDKEKFPNVDTLKKYLSENPMTVQYALAEPIIEPLAEENKLALESLYTNNGTTVIAVDGGEVEAKIEVEYAVKE